MLVINVLGELELELDGRRVEPPTRQSGRLLIGYLALNPGLHSRADLAALLWPDILETSARVSLRSAVAAVRRSLGPDADRHLLVSSDAVGLADTAAGVQVDAREFDRLVAEGQPAAALELPRGVLLQGLDAEWVRQARIEHLDRESALLGQLAQGAEDAGRLEEAIRYTRRQVALSPLAEPPNRELIRRLTATGDRASALAVYGTLIERFRRELHTVPSLPTRRLAEQARRGDAAERPLRLPLPSTVTRMLDEPFVNRQDELAKLIQAIRLATAGERQIAVLRGEPGIGKSRLLARLAHAAHPQATVLFGRARRPSTGPFEPVVEALTHYLSNFPAEAPRLFPPGNEVAALFPGVSRDLESSAFSSPDQLEDGSRVDRALAEIFLSLAREQPLLLLLDDLHDADGRTLDLVARLLAGPETVRLMIVISFRDTQAALSTQLRQLTGQLRITPGNLEIVLRGLKAGAIGELARAAGQDEAARESIQHLERRTKGNPFFVTVLLRSENPFSDSPLPQQIQDLVWQETEQLSPEAQACLGVAALAGEEFDLATVAGVAGYEETRALDALDEAVLARVVTELESGVGLYQFRHALLRESIQARLTATRQAHIHRRLAESLLRRRGQGADQSLSAVLEHLRLARDLVPASELIQCLLQAADESEGRGSFDQAADLYDEAAERLPAQRGQVPHRAEVLVSLGHAARRAGQNERATQAFQMAYAVGAGVGATESQLEAALGLCRVPVTPGDRPVDQQIVGLLESALDLAAGRDDTVAQLLARLALETYYDEARERPEAMAGQAVAAARRSGTPSALLAALSVGHLVFRDPAGPEERLRLAHALEDSARRGGGPEHLLGALVHKTVDQVQLGELEALTANATALSELAIELRQPAYNWWAELWRATHAIATGDLEAGAALAQRAHATGGVSFGPAADLELRAQLAWIALEQGRFEQLAAALPGLEGSFSVLPVWQALKALILIESGDEKLARQSAAELIGRGLTALERDTNWLISAALLAQTIARIGDPAAAAKLSEVLASRAGHWAISARGTVCLGPLAGSLAPLSALLGDPGQAERQHTAAQEQCLKVGAHPAAARLKRIYDACLAPRGARTGSS